MLGHGAPPRGDDLGAHLPDRRPRREPGWQRPRRLGDEALRRRGGDRRNAPGGRARGDCRGGRDEVSRARKSRRRDHAAGDRERHLANVDGGRRARRCRTCPHRRRHAHVHRVSDDGRPGRRREARAAARARARDARGPAALPRRRPPSRGPARRAGGAAPSRESIRPEAASVARARGDQRQLPGSARRVPLSCRGRRRAERRLNGRASPPDRRRGRPSRSALCRSGCSRRRRTCPLSHRSRRARSAVR